LKGAGAVSLSLRAEFLAKLRSWHAGICLPQGFPSFRMILLHHSNSHHYLKRAKKKHEGYGYPQQKNNHGAKGF
jgi:hypothetical protein